MRHCGVRLDKRAHHRFRRADARANRGATGRVVGRGHERGGRGRHREGACAPSSRTLRHHAGHGAQQAVSNAIGRGARQPGHVVRCSCTSARPMTHHARAHAPFDWPVSGRGAGGAEESATARPGDRSCHQVGPMPRPVVPICCVFSSPSTACGMACPWARSDKKATPKSIPARSARPVGEEGVRIEHDPHCRKAFARWRMPEGIWCRQNWHRRPPPGGPHWHHPIAHHAIRLLGARRRSFPFIHRPLGPTTTKQLCFRRQASCSGKRKRPLRAAKDSIKLATGTQPSNRPTAGNSSPAILAACAIAFESRQCQRPNDGIGQSGTNRPIRPGRTATSPSSRRQALGRTARSDATVGILVDLTAPRAPSSHELRTGRGVVPGRAISSVPIRRSQGPVERRRVPQFTTTIRRSLRIAARSPCAGRRCRPDLRWVSDGDRDGELADPRAHMCRCCAR